MTPDETITAATPQTTPVSPTAGMTTKVMKGSVWSMLGQVLPMAVAMISTPFLIRMLGAESYGVVVLVGLIPAYLTFTDLGMGIASTKYGSEAFGEHQLKRESRVVTTATLIALFTVLPFSAAIFAFSGFWVHLLNVPDHLRSDADLAFKFAAIALTVNVLSNIVNTPQLARLRLDLNTFVTAGFRIVGSVLAPIIVYLGGGISGAVLAVMAANILTFVGHVVVSGRLNPDMLRPSFDREMFGPLLRFGGAYALSGVASVFLVHLEKLVLVKQTTVKELAYYSVAFTFSNVATLFTASIIQSLMPAFSQLLAPERRTQLTALFQRGLRISIFSVLPMIAIMSIWARPFFNLWAGPDFGRESTLPFYILLIGLFFNLNAYLPAGLLLASGRTDLYAKQYWLELIPYIAIAALLTGRYGAVGAAAAWSIRVIADSTIFFVLARRVIGMHYGLLSRLPLLLLAFGIFLLPVSVAIYYSRIDVAIAASVISMAIYAWFFWKAVLVADETAWLKTRINRSLTTLRIPLHV